MFKQPKRLAQLGIFLLGLSLCTACAKYKMSVQQTKSKASNSKRAAPASTNRLSKWVERVPSTKADGVTQTRRLLQFIKHQQKEITLAKAQRASKQNKKSPSCKTICRAAKGICLSSQHICKIAQKFPREKSFQKACLKAKKDCHDARYSCSQCEASK